MAVSEREFDITDKRVVQGTATNPLAAPLEYTSTSAMRTRLAAFNGSYYTTTQLNLMTKNDLEYALRLADDAGGI